MDRRLSRIRWPALALLAATLALAGCSRAGPSPQATALAALERSPVFDGHNDLAVNFITNEPHWSLENVDLGNLTGQSNLSKWREGHVGGAIITTGSTLEPDAPGQFQSLRRSFEWFDALVAKHSAAVAKVTTLQELRAARRRGKIALIMGVEGGSQIDDSIDNLRAAYQLGVRSITIIYNDNNALGDGSLPPPVSKRPAVGGLAPFGRTVIAEMNRLGMIVDLSHASEASAQQAIVISRAPVIFSHSAARALVDTPRNLSDETLKMVRGNGGVVMVPLVPYFVSATYSSWWNAGEDNYARLQQLYANDAARASAEAQRWDNENPAPAVTVADVADHVDHVAKVAGHDHVGVGTDFDGMGSHVIPALSDASMLPQLFVELARRGWSQQQLEGLAAGNFERVFAAVEAAADR